MEKEMVPDPAAIAAWCDGAMGLERWRKIRFH